MTKQQTQTEVASGFRGRIIRLPNVDFSKAPEPWNEKVAELASIMYVLDIDSKKPSADWDFAVLMDGLLYGAICWLYKKKWNKRFKFPGDRNFKKVTEPLGDIFLSALNLCEALHTIGYGAEHPNAGVWFSHVGDDLKKLFFLQAFGETSVSSDIAFFRSLVSAYREEINPHQKSEYPHLWGLVEHALTVRKQGFFPDLIRKFWVGKQNAEFPGFIKALSQYTTFLDHEKGLRRLYRDGDKILARSPKKQEKDKIVYSLQKV